MLAQQRRRWTLAAPVIIVLLALALRLFRLGASPLRGDEAFTIQYWPAGWADALALVGTDPHPWGAYALFAAWRGIFGDGEWVMRLLPALLSIPGVAASYALGKMLFKRLHTAWLAALFYAIHPFLIWHAQDVRNYAIWTSFSLISAWAFVTMLKRNSRRNQFIYILTTVLSIYIFFLHAFMIAAQGVYVLAARRDRLRTWMVAMVIVALLMIPWGVEIMTAAGGGYNGTAGRFAPALLITWFLPVLSVGSTLPVDALPAIGVAVFVVGTALLAMIWRKQSSVALLLASQVVVPVALLVGVALRMPVFRPRYVIPTAPWVMLLLAGGIVGLLTTRNARSKLIGAVLLLALVLLDGQALANYYTNPAYRKAPDWRTIGAYLTAHTLPGDLVVQQALDPAFTYYFRGPADETTLPLSPDAPAEETTAILQEAINRRRAVWLIPAEIPGYDNAHVPLDWLTDQTQNTADITVAGFRVLEFRSWEVRPEEYTPRFEASFAGIATLLDWQVERLSADVLRVILYWQADSRTTEALNGFVHLIGPLNPATGSPLWTQEDHRIPGSITDTTRWSPGEIRRDVYQLQIPPSLPDGPWTLHLGLYTPSNMSRIPVAADDHLEIPLDAHLQPME